MVGIGCRGRGADVDGYDGAGAPAFGDEDAMRIWSVTRCEARISGGDVDAPEDHDVGAVAQLA
jgi:hypothetical protein